MAKTPAGNNITIEFKARGEKQLIAAINALQVSSTTLASSQKKLGTSIGLTNKAQQSSIATGALALRNQRNMTGANIAGAASFSVFRSKLLLATFALGLYAMTVGKLTKAAMEQESSERRLSAAIVSTGAAAGLTNHEIFAMTANLEKVGVVGDEVNNKVAGLLLTFTNIGADVFPLALKGINDMAIGMEQAIPEFSQLKTSAIQLGKALQEPDKQYNALRKSGFSFDEAQVALIKSSMKANDITTAQGVILEALKTQFGGLNEAMRATSEGTMAALGNSLGTVAEDIGAMLLPMVVSLADGLTKLFDTFHKNRDAIETAVVALGIIAAGIAAVVLVMGGWIPVIVGATLGLAGAAVMIAAFLTPLKMLHKWVSKMIEPMMKARQEARKTIKTADDLLKKQLKQIEVNKALGEALIKLEQDLVNVNAKGEIQIENLRLQNAEILGLTDSTIAMSKAKVRALMINQAMLDIDEDMKDASRDAVTAIVDRTIAIAAEKSEIKSVIKELKNEAKVREELAKKNDSFFTEFEKYLVVSQKLKEVNSSLEKQDFSRIENITTFHNELKGLTNKGLNDFAGALSGTAELNEEMFSSLEGVDRDIAIALLSRIRLQEQLDNTLDSLIDKTKVLTMHQKFLADSFVIGAQQGIEAFTGMVESQGELVEQRMKREMEAVKASSEYELATQEERQIMEDNVNRKFRDARRKQFKMEKLSNIAVATMQVAEAVTKALPNPPLAALVAALGAAQVASIAAQPAPRFATGGSFITTGARNIMVGEQGAEKITIQPLGGRNARQGSSSGQTININVSAPLIDETILDVIIPKIREAGKLSLA